MATVETLELRIVDNSVKAANGVNKLAATLQRLKGITSGNLGLVKVSNQMERFTKAISGLNEDYVRRLERTAKAIQKISAAGKLNLPTYNQIKRATEPSKKKVEEVIPETKQSGIAAFLNRITSSLGPTNALRLSLNRLGDAADKANKKVNAPGKRGYGFLDSAKFLLKYQLIFKLFSMVTNAVKEGISNLYEWSKATNGVFAKSLDSAKSKILLLKNSIATALAPAITALIPVFNAVANAVVFCLNAIAQFISAIRGIGTWTKATEAVDGYTEAVKGAGAAHKGLLASFDELNVIGSSGGGGGGGASNLWEGAFEEKELSPFFAWIKDHLSLVKTLALGVGTAILGWKIASGFTTSVSGVSGNFKKILGFALAISGGVMEISSMSDALANGNSWDTFGGQVAGAAGVVGGLAMMFGRVGAEVGLLAAGIPMLVSGFGEWIKTGQLADETLSTIITGLSTVGVGLSLLTGSWIPLAIAGVIAAALLVLDNLDLVEKCVNQLIAGFKDLFGKNYSTTVTVTQQNIIETVYKETGKKYTSEELHTMSGGDPMNALMMNNYNEKKSNDLQNPFGVSLHADGGFVNSGQLFVAREAGPELVGTIGGRTAVANNDQIIAGVASGVAAGQEEQNALLRKQNEILTRLLAKEFSAKVVPSAALGRVASQSEAMYRQMAGVNV